LGPVFIFCAPGHVFGGTEGVRSRFHVLRARTSFRRYRGRRVPFSCFPLPGKFSAVPRASGLVFMFCALEVDFDGTGGVVSWRSSHDRFTGEQSWSRKQVLDQISVWRTRPKSYLQLINKTTALLTDSYWASILGITLS
jgi:hypothetical protein